MEKKTKAGNKFPHIGFGNHLKSLLAVDFRRMFTMRLFYIMLGIAVAIPVLVLVMTTMMDGSVSVDPNTGVETTVEAFDSVWQAIGSIGTESSASPMSLTSMCNINLVYFLAAVLICIFTADDFRSGYVKNLFTVHAMKTDYVISKILVGFTGSALLLAGFFVGAMAGGVISGLPFEFGTATAAGIVMSMFSKILLMAAFSAIYVLMGVIAKQRLWLSMLLSLMMGMFLFNLVPAVTPLTSTMLNVLLCLAAGVLAGAGLGVVSKFILRKGDIL